MPLSRPLKPFCNLPKLSVTLQWQWYSDKLLSTASVAMVIFVIIGNNITSLVTRENIFQAFFILFHSNSFTGASFFREVLSSLFHFSKAVNGKQSQLSLTCCVIISAALQWLSLLGKSVAISFTVRSFVAWTNSCTFCTFLGCMSQKTKEILSKIFSIWFENQSYLKAYYMYYYKITVL